MKHLQKNGYPISAACLDPGVRDNRTWNLVDVTCEECRKSSQYQDAQRFGDIGSKGRETSIGVIPRAVYE